MVHLVADQCARRRCLSLLPLGPLLRLLSATLSEMCAGSILHGGNSLRPSGLSSTSSWRYPTHRYRKTERHHFADDEKRPAYFLCLILIAGAGTIAALSEQKRINTLVTYLGRPGGAVYVKEKELVQADSDLIIVHTLPLPFYLSLWHLVYSSILPSDPFATPQIYIQVHPNSLHRLASLVPGILECRLNPAVTFVRGIDFLENCCRRNLLLTPHPTDAIYPSGTVLHIMMFLFPL